MSQNKQESAPAELAREYEAERQPKMKMYIGKNQNFDVLSLGLKSLTKVAVVQKDSERHANKSGNCTIDPEKLSNKSGDGTERLANQSNASDNNNKDQERYDCEHCGKTFAQAQSLYRHVRDKHKEKWDEWKKDEMKRPETTDF